MKSLAYWGILAVKIEISKRVSKKGDSLTKIGTRSYHHTSSVHFNRGTPPPSLSIQHGGHQSPVNRSSAEIQGGLNSKCMTALYNYIKGGWNKLPTRRFVPVDFKKPCAKNTLSLQPNSRGRWTPNDEGACAITLATTNVDEPARRCSRKKYFVKIYQKINQIKKIQQKRREAR